MHSAQEQTCTWLHHISVEGCSGLLGPCYFINFDTCQKLEGDEASLPLVLSAGPASQSKIWGAVTSSAAESCGYLCFKLTIAQGGAHGVPGRKCLQDLTFYREFSHVYQLQP